MSLSIPNAPNAGLFKQGYQKYGPLQPRNHNKHSTNHPATATTLRMALLFATSMPAGLLPRPFRPLSDPTAATRSS
ncbi:T-complex protein 1 subunit theta [Alternaria alternata]|nr:T-complex protein 1 subunit theta [Alternaria alternata]